MSEGAAISWMVQDAGDGHPSFGWDAARIQCPKCDGWEGTACPHGCGVRLVSVQAEKDAEAMAEMHWEQAERKARRDALAKTSKTKGPS